MKQNNTQSIPEITDTMRINFMEMQARNSFDLCNKPFPMGWRKPETGPPLYAMNTGDGAFALPTLRDAVDAAITDWQEDDESLAEHTRIAARIF